MGGPCRCACAKNAVRTGIAGAKKPVLMAEAMRLGVDADFAKWVDVEEGIAGSGLWYPAAGWIDLPRFCRAALERAGVAPHAMQAVLVVDEVMGCLHRVAWTAIWRLRWSDSAAKPVGAL